jgi:hypothetical protein
MFALQSSSLVRHQKGGRIVQSIAECLFAENFVSLRVRGIPEFGKYFVVRFILLNGSRRCLIVFQEHEIAQERFHWRLERSFFVRPPEIMGVADSFLNAIVEVVAVGWSCVGFDFDAGQQISIRDGQQIPSLCGPEVTWKVGIYFPSEYFGIGDARIFQKIPDDPEKTVKLLSSRYLGSFSPIADFSAAPPRSCLPGSCFPVVLNGFSDTVLDELVEACHGPPRSTLR